MHIADLEAKGDEELVAQFVATDDRDALEVLLRRHETRVYGLAFRLLGNRADALDASQEAFLNVFRKARSFKGEAAFTTWLHRLTVNACHDLGRKRARSPQPTLPKEIVSEDPTLRADESIAVTEALAALPEDQRTVVILRDLRGLAYQEIAVVTNVPVGTVKSRIARARTALAGLLEDPQFGEPPQGRTRLKDKE